MIGALASAGTGLIGAGIQAYATQQAAKSNSKDLRWNAMMARMNANEVVAQAETYVLDLRRSAADLQSAQLASLAAQGVDVSSSTVTNILEETGRRASEDINRTRTAAAKQAWGLNVEAKQYRGKAKAVTRQARYSMLAGLIGAGGSASGTMIGAQ